MRYTEFNLTEDELFELNMSPGNLKKMARDIDARAGMEFELIVPGAGSDDDGDLEPDYDQDERCRSIEDAVQFFHDGDYNGRSEVQRLRDRMSNDFQEWLDDKIYRDWERDGEEYLEEWVPNNVDESEWNPEGLEGDARQEALEELIANMHSDPGGSDAFDEYREENYGSYDESDWLDDEDLDRMSAIEGTYDVSWPHWTSAGGGEASIDEIADDFSQAIGRPVNSASSYHGATRQPGKYVVEPDGSLEGDDGEKGLEFVSPPLPISELLSDLDKIVEWAGRVGAYTNESTGLHMNVSVPDQKNLDYVKLAMFLGDEYILDQFGREGNTYCKSAMQKIRLQAGRNPDRVAEMMRQFQSGLNQLASKMIHTGSTEKFTSINNRGDWIEFRGPGGDWLRNDNGITAVKNTLLRTVVALDVATKPEAFKQEYYKKLYKTLNPKGDDDSIQYFARYAAGELPKAALKSFVRQAQLQRGVNRGKETGPMWWRVYKEGKDARNGAVIEVVASSKEEALDKAAKDWGVFSDEYRRAMYAEPVRPYKQEGRLVTLTGRPSNPDGNYVIVNAATQAPAYRYMASDMTDATLVLRQWITANPGTQWDFKRDPEMRLGQPGASTTASHPEGRGRPHNPTGRYGIVARSDQAAYGRTGGPPPAYQFRFDMANLADQGHGRYVLQAWAARNSVDPADYIVVDTTQYADAAQMPTIDIDVEPAPAPQRQPAQAQAQGTGSLPPGNARWRILDRNDQEVYSFVNTTAQSDANQYARNWMINTAPADIRNRGPFNIVPVT